MAYFGMLTSENNDVVIEISEQKLITVNQIMYIRAQDKYVDIYTAKEKLPGYLSMKVCMLKLSGNKFTRPNRSYIVNMDHIKKITDHIIMNDGFEISIKRGMIKSFKHQYREYLRKNTVHEIEIQFTN